MLVIVQLVICTLGYIVQQRTGLVDDVAPQVQMCRTFSVIYNSFTKNVEQKSWIILDVLVCSIAEYFYSLFVF